MRFHLLSPDDLSLSTKAASAQGPIPSNSGHFNGRRKLKLSITECSKGGTPNLTKARSWHAPMESLVLSLSKLSQHGTFIPLGAHASYANRCPTQNLLCRQPRGLIGRPAVGARGVNAASPLESSRGTNTDTEFIAVKGV
jgi:hypothetical protein